VRDNHPTNITCPRCGAEPGERCVTRSGAVYCETLGHMARRKALITSGKTLSARDQAIQLAGWLIKRTGSAARARTVLDETSKILRTR